MLSAFQKKKKKLSSKLQIQILNFISIALPHYIQIATHCFFTVSLKRVHTTHLPRLNPTILVLSFPCACVCVHVCVCLFSCISLFATPWTAAWHAPLSIEFSRQEYWIELSFPTPGDLLNAGVKPVSLVFPALAGRFFTTALPGKPPFPNHFILRKSIRPQQENYLTTPDLLSVDSYCQEQRKFYFFQTKVILTVSFAYSLNSNQWLNHTYNKSYYSIKVNKIESFMLQQCTKISLYSSVQSLSLVRHFAIPWTTACQASPSITNSQSLPKPRSIESVMPCNHLILCCPLLLLPSISPSIRVFSNESALRIR